jgi:choloylglycine hydrolase
LNTDVNLNTGIPHQTEFMAVETAIGAVPRAVGHGWNLFGLPGDGSPPSRFVQLFYQRGYATRTAPPRTLTDAMVLVTGLLNKVFIPLGTFAADKRSPGDMPEYTPYAVLKLPWERQFLYRGYKNLGWKRIDLNHLDFDVEPSKAPHWPIEDGSLGIEDLNGPATMEVVL